MTAPDRVHPGYFHRVGIAADPDGSDLTGWLTTALGARPIPGGMAQAQGLPFGSGPMRSAESGARTDLLWLGDAPFAVFTPDDPAGPLGHYVRRHGSGLHSLAWTVDDLWGTENRLRKQGVRITGADVEGRHFFMHPADSAGLLIEWTDTVFAEDPRDGAELPEPPELSGSPLGIRTVAWTTTVVRDAATAAQSLARLMDVTEVTGNPAGPAEDDDTIDLAIGDTVLRLVSPRTPGSRYAGVLGDRQGRLHSFCLGVDDLDTTIKALSGQGISLTDRVGRQAWTDPVTTGGLHLEWTELG